MVHGRVEILWRCYDLNTMFSFQTIIPLRTLGGLFISHLLRISNLSLNVVAVILRPLISLLPRTMLSRPRGLRLLYSSLAASVLLGLYWLASSEDGAVAREFRQPSPLQQQQDYYGRGQFIKAPLNCHYSFKIICSQFIVSKIEKIVVE